jgi:hypothetical protein
MAQIIPVGLQVSRVTKIRTKLTQKPSTKCADWHRGVVSVGDLSAASVDPCDEVRLEK